jgi:hypothetical protein
MVMFSSLSVPIIPSQMNALQHLQPYWQLQQPHADALLLPPLCCAPQVLGRTAFHTNFSEVAARQLRPTAAQVGLMAMDEMRDTESLEARIHFLNHLSRQQVGRAGKRGRGCWA